MLKIIVLLLMGYTVLRVVRAKKPDGAVNAVIVVVLAGSLLAIAWQRELWPFSHYPMFSSRQSDQLVRTRLYGLTRDAPPREIPLLGPAIAPFGEPDLVFALDRLEQKTNGQQRVERAVRDCLSRYEQRRRRGLHPGPPLQGIRLYLVRWTLDGEAGNRDQPDQRQLLLEVVPERPVEAAAFDLSRPAPNPDSPIPTSVVPDSEGERLVVVN